MSEELYVDGLGLAPGVMETIIAIAARDVEGVASVGSSSFSGLRSRFAAKPAGRASMCTLMKATASRSPCISTCITASPSLRLPPRCVRRSLTQ